MSHHDRIQPVETQLEAQDDIDTKNDVLHLEMDQEKGRAEEIVMDNEAAGYVNHDLVIDEAENKRLRKIVNRR
jgi:hypothetical protein